MADLHLGQRAGLEDRFLNDQDAVVLGCPVQQVLGALPDEIPPEVRKTDEQGSRLIGASGDIGTRTSIRTLLHSAFLRLQRVVISRTAGPRADGCFFVRPAEA